MRNANVGIYYHPAELFGAQCKVCILKIHKKSFVKPAELFKDFAPYAKKAAAAKVNIGNGFNFPICPCVTISYFLKTTAETRKPA